MRSYQEMECQIKKDLNIGRMSAGALRMRTQADDRGDEVSRETATDFTGEKDMTRQEFAADADINVLANKFNLDQLRKPITWGGEIDMTIDLQQSLNAIAQSKQAYNRLHPELRDLYPNWQSFVEGMNSGKLADDLKKIGLNEVSIQEVKELDDQILRDQRRTARSREREANELAERVKRGEKFTTVPEGKPKD